MDRAALRQTQHSYTPLVHSNIENCTIRFTGAHLILLLERCLSLSLSVCNFAYSSKTKHRIDVIFSHMVGNIVGSVQIFFVALC